MVKKVCFSCIFGSVKRSVFFTKIRSVFGLFFNLIRSVWILGNPVSIPASHNQTDEAIEVIPDFSDDEDEEARRDAEQLLLGY